MALEAILIVDLLHLEGTLDLLDVHLHLPLDLFDPHLHLLLALTIFHSCFPSNIVQCV